jgi:ABC-type multidrug transport system fused ATPase/permease subunit
MKTVQKFLELLSPAEQKRAFILVGMVVIMAMLDVVGVASIMPFIAVLANPQLITLNPILAAAYLAFEFETSQDFLFALGVLVFVVLVISLIFKALTIYAQTRFALMREYSIGKRLVESYLHQPYSWFLNRHSADLGKTILSEVGNLIHGGMLPLMTLMAQSAVALGLMLLLLIVNPLLAIGVGFALGLAYFIVFKIMSKWLKYLGEARVLANQQRFTAVSEAFGAIKELKVGGLEHEYTKRFSEPAEIYAKGQSAAQIIALLPRYVIEAIAFGGMLLVVLFLMAESGSFADALPIVALYAFAGYRLLPALQQIYGTLTLLRYAEPALDALHRDLKSLASYEVNNENSQSIIFTNSITLNNIEFTYPNAAQPAIKALNLCIKAKSSVGIVGSTGSGKSTIIDLILGIIEPTQGRLMVDEQDIQPANQRMWQKIIGYVPQQIYLSDDTVEANIAFGVRPEHVDKLAVEKAAKIANLHDFIVEDLPQGYKTSVGERGVRLSGGQRQRIGIARALYHGPQVLILDEATSALDNVTEQAVMDAVQKLNHEITIIIIAHRLSTVRHCDNIILLERGEVEQQGSYRELIVSSKRFSLMAAIN